MAGGKLKSFFNSTVGMGDEIKSFLFTSDGTALTQSGGALDVNIASSDINITVNESDVYAEDSAHTSGDLGEFMLAIRNNGDAASATVGPNVFTADNPGEAGNSISLVFDGILDVSAVVTAWNTANPGNTVSFTGAGATVPSAQTTTLSGGADFTTLTSSNGDYSGVAVDQFGRLFTQDAAVLAQLQTGVTISDGGGSITVDATSLDIRDLDFATDTVDVSGSQVSISGSVAVTQATTPWEVEATDLDIRDLTAVSDSVASLVNDGIGNPIDSLGGALRVTDHADTIAASTLVVEDTATAIAAAATQSRIMVQNLDSKTIYVGDSGVTSGAGYPIDKNEFIELPFSGTLYAITNSGSTAAGNVRVLKLSA